MVLRPFTLDVGVTLLLPLSRWGNLFGSPSYGFVSRKVRLSHHPEGRPLAQSFTVAFAFRLVPISGSKSIREGFRIADYAARLLAFKSTPTMSFVCCPKFPRVSDHIFISPIRESLVLRALRPTLFRDGLYTFLFRGSARYYPRHYPFRAPPNSPGLLRHLAVT